jgi:ribonuclease P protein component
VPEAKLRFQKAMRLTHALEYQRAYKRNARKHAGPLVVFGYAAGLDHPRLGLAASRRVGNAVKRNRIKRRLREAFRLEQRRLPSIDLVVRVRPHDPMSVDDYREWLLGAARRVQQKLTSHDA